MKIVLTFRVGQAEGMVHIQKKKINTSSLPPTCLPERVPVDPVSPGLILRLSHCHWMVQDIPGQSRHPWQLKNALI